MEPLLEQANESHIEKICNLVNKAYRGETGWTIETHLVSGNRSTESEIRKYITDKSTHLLIYKIDNIIISCICIELKSNNAHIGLFAVEPHFQGKGLGKKILLQAEKYASNNFNVKNYVMTVVSQRKELIEYYERRGYVRFGEIIEYPTQLSTGVNTGTPVKNLTIEYLKKHV